MCVNVTNDIYGVYGGGIFQYDVRVLDGNTFNGRYARSMRVL